MEGWMADNVLYYGDNLDVLRHNLKDESVHLVYLDPPFSSNASYNVLFAAQDGTRSAAQLQAFEDTWRWDQTAAFDYQKTVEAGGQVSQAMQAFHTLLGPSNMLAYLAMMAPRLLELRRVLKPTGSLYLHCDQTASHYLKLLLDAVFGVENFRSEIIWKRTYGHGNVGRSYGSVCDNLLFCTRSPVYTWNQPYVPASEEYIKQRFSYQDPDGRRWQSVTLRNPSPRPNLRFPFAASNGITYQPHPNGWACDKARLEQYDRENRLHFPAKPTGQLRLKMYLDESPGQKVQNLWTDIYPINSQAAERLGYPTQKPEALLERIIRTSSNEGDLVLDPFCGCGTAIAVAQRLKRRWIGIDITYLAVSLMKYRLKTAFGEGIAKTYNVIGEPVSVEDAKQLAHDDPYQFQWWAVGLVSARAVEKKKGADQGIDGRLYFHDDYSGKTKQIILSVKAGKTGPDHVRDLRGVVERENAQIGVLITMQKPTQPMRSETAAAGFYVSPVHSTHPKIQLLTITELLNGKRIDYPSWQENMTFKKAPKARSEAIETPTLDL